MAHIPDGILSLPVIVATSLPAAGGLALGLRRLDEAALPRTALVAAVFFVASSIAFPLGPTSVHLLLGGLAGLVLGVAAFPAIFVGLMLQALLFGFGGLTTLGADTLNMALPGVALAALARPLLKRRRPVAIAAAAISAALSVIATAGLVTLEIGVSDPRLMPAGGLIAAAYLPLSAIEAVVTGVVVAYLLTVEQRLLGLPPTVESTGDARAEAAE